MSYKGYKPESNKIMILLQLLSISLILVTTCCCIIYPQPTGPDTKNYSDIQQQSRQIMGTIVTIEIITSEPGSQTALYSAFDEISNVEDMMSIYKPNSMISRLNTQGRINGAPQDLVDLINRSIYYGKISNGAFDITIQPLLDLWRTKISAGEYPTEQEINDTLILVNYSNITVEKNTITFNMQGMAITPGGIAKGYAVDRAVNVLNNQGYMNGFVNAGGDGMYFGTNQDGSYWRVGLRNPDNKSESIVILNISDRAVATSGNYERFFNESAHLSHISDPRSGYSCQSLISATVIADSAQEADALATTVFVLGREEGIRLIESINKTECLLITSDRKLIRSSGFKTYETS